jgi:hypothetical protein
LSAGFGEGTQQFHQRLLVELGAASRLLLLFVRAVKEGFLVHSYARMIVPIAYYPVHGSCNIAATDIANNGAVGTAEVVRLRTNPIMVLDCSLYSATVWDRDPHSSQELARIS